MPEGHTIHRLARDLDALFAAGERIAVSSPQGRFDASAALLDGAAYAGSDAYGKHLFIGFADDRWIHVHLGLYGGFALLAAVPEPPRGAVRLRLVGKAGHADLRGPNACELVGPAERGQVIARLGPDPLRDDADPDRVWTRVSRSTVPIAALLLAQDIAAGVGNVYRAEVLFRAGVDPLLPGRLLPHEVWQAMWHDLCALMREGVTHNRIDTVREEHTPEAMGRPPRVDDHGGEVYVYRRTGQPCHVCGTPVATQVLRARNLFWCPRCQPPGAVGA